MTSILKVDSIQNAAGTAAMTIDSAGRILTPARPVFRARHTSGSTVGVQGDIVFNAEDFDIGSNYNASNGRFTAPVAGVYSFAFDGLSAGTAGGAPLADSAAAEVSFHKNGAQGAYSPRFYVFTQGASNYITMHLEDLIQLAANDYIQVNVNSNYVYSDASGNFDPTFQGFLIG